MEKKSPAEPVPENAGMPLVHVQVAPSFSSIVSVDRLRGVVEGVLRHEGILGEVTLVVIDDSGIQQLNRDYLGKDAPTDVLSFPTQEEDVPGDHGQFVGSPEAEGYLGDVIVSYPRAVAQAGGQGHPVEQELDLLIVHGVLHLLGYDHASEEEQAVMWARQEEILGHPWNPRTPPISARD